MLSKILKILGAIKNSQKRPKNLTTSEGPSDISEKWIPGQARNDKLIMESLICPYCSSKNFVRRGFRKKKFEFEKVQL
jgi:hypothetical protein